MEPYSVPEKDDISLALTKYRLSPDVPKSDIDMMENFERTRSKLFPLSNLTSREMYRIFKIFENIVLVLNQGHIEIAEYLQNNIDMRLQASRGIGGFETMMQSGAYRLQRQEVEQNAQTGRTEHKGFFSFRKKKNNEEVE
jgi:hypothetical protein